MTVVEIKVAAASCRLNYKHSNDTKKGQNIFMIVLK